MGTVPTAVDQQNQARPRRASPDKRKANLSRAKRQNRPSQSVLPSTSGVHKGRARSAVVNKRGQKGGLLPLLWRGDLAVALSERESAGPVGDGA